MRTSTKALEQLREKALTEVRTMMIEVGARRMWVINGPRDTQVHEMEAWSVGQRIVIVQYYKDGGCDHYVQSNRHTWDDMSTEMHQLAAEAV